MDFSKGDPLISYLELTNYRVFERYRLSGLARVNLLVGRNNSGKTSILEAVNLLDAVEDVVVLSRIPSERGEIVSIPDESGQSEEFANVFHLFHGHEPAASIALSIATNERSVRFSLDAIEKLDYEQLSLFEDLSDLRRRPRTVAGRTIVGPRPLFSLAIEGNVTPADKNPVPHLVSEEGALLTVPWRRFRRSLWKRGAASQLISAGSLGITSMKSMWDRVNIEGRQSEVIKSLNILDNSLIDVFFLTSDQAARDGILIATEGRSQRIPLGSFGEGMRRLLALSLALICNRGSTLLIDEIDTGLHYSIMGDLWRMVVEAARRNDVQVFATTHSLDCVRGLAWFCEHHPELAEDVSLQKIEPILEEAVAFDARQIQIAAEQDIEVR